MTPVLQLLVFVGAIAGLVAFGFYRDKKEHNLEKDSDQRQHSLHFPDAPAPREDETRHQGAAMSHIG